MMTDAEKLSQHLTDWAATDTEVRTLALRVLTESEVHGNSNGVPMIEDIVELLVQEIESLQKSC